MVIFDKFVPIVDMLLWQHEIKYQTCLIIEHFFPIIWIFDKFSSAIKTPVCSIFLVPVTLFHLKGFTSGSQYNEKGNGVNTLCLPHDPENLLTTISVSTGNDYAHLYGAEYQFNIGRIQIDDNVPCAVCRTTMASSTIMIPGKRSCPIHWQKQYTGILTANWYDYQESEYLCIDEDPDYVEGSRRNENGRLFYPVKTVCGSLPCPPYENGNLLSCVVCSK